jgi:hypothetical protein
MTAKTLRQDDEEINPREPTADVVVNKTYVLLSPEILPIDVLVKQGHERAGLENLVRDGKVRSVRIGRKVCVVVRDLIELATKEPKTKRIVKAVPFTLTNAISERRR